MHQLMNIRLLILFLLTALNTILISSCDKNRYYDKNITIERKGWDYGETKKFDITITDTTAAYNIYVNVRHTDDYEFKNIWLNITAIFPDSSTHENKINVELAKPDGEWIGNCVDDICYTTVLIQSNTSFQLPGNYIFEIEQDMRVKTLTNILDIGLKIEKLDFTIRYS